MDEEIQKLFQTGLKNRAHTLTLSRLMVRAEDWSTRGKLLKLIREGETPCRRLFLDYHGLRLICSWMLSRELEESNDKNDRRLEVIFLQYLIGEVHSSKFAKYKIIYYFRF